MRPDFCVWKKNNRNFLWLWIEVKSLRDFYSDLHFYFTSNFIVFYRFKKVKACANIIWHFKHTYQNKVTQIVSLDWENLLRNCERLFMRIVKQDKKKHRTTNQIAKKWTGAKMVEPCNIGWNISKTSFFTLYAEHLRLDHKFQSCHILCHLVILLFSCSLRLATAGENQMMWHRKQIIKLRFCWVQTKQAWKKHTFTPSWISLDRMALWCFKMVNILWNSSKIDWKSHITLNAEIRNARLKLSSVTSLSIIHKLDPKGFSILEKNNFITNFIGDSFM